MAKWPSFRLSYTCDTNVKLSSLLTILDSAYYHNLVMDTYICHAELVSLSYKLLFCQEST